MINRGMSHVSVETHWPEQHGVAISISLQHPVTFKQCEEVAVKVSANIISCILTQEKKKKRTKMID